MTITLNNLGNGFSREAMKQAVADEKISKERAVELNELASQVAEQFVNDPISPSVVTGMTRLFEFLGLATIGIALYLLHMSSQSSFSSWYIPASFLGATFTVGFAQGLDAYLVSSMRQIANQFAKITTAHTMSMLTMALLVFLVGELNPEVLTWLAKWFGLGAGFLFLSRILICTLVWQLSRDGRLERRAVIIGGGQPASDLINSMESNQASDIRICGIFDDRTDDRSPDIVAGYPKLGNVAELIEFARKTRINMLIVALPLNAEKRVLQLLKRLWILPIDIRLSAHTNKLLFRPRSYTYEGTVPFLNVYDRPIADWDSVMKRAFDVCFATGALIALAPLMVLTAIAVKLDSNGPVFFKQKREGFNNEEIEIFKFRSLHHNQGDASGINVVTKGDSRVTRVGRIIRKSSIDELPQLFNVLAGTLSLVGPRPHVVNAQTGDKLWTDVVDSYIARHKVKPGVTGWAQINGWRGEIDDDEKLQGRIDHDLYYIENWSLLFDLYILAITPLKLLDTKNAY